MSGLVRWLKANTGLMPNRIWPEIAAALQAGLGTRLPVGLTIVLQTWSDQFSPTEVNRLIGATLYSGLLCCYGEWCESDGRSRPTWPHSARVPVRYAKTVIQREIRRVAAGRTVMPLTASRDEIFLHRLRDKSRVTKSRMGTTAIVLSPDRILRETWILALCWAGCRAAGVRPEADLSPVDRATSIVLHDLDPDATVFADSFDRYRREFPAALLVGIASRPNSAAAIVNRGRDRNILVLPKLDPLIGVAELLAQCHGLGLKTA